VVLVVDDHASTRSALVRLITLAGFECVGVATGPQALQFLSTAKPNLIILDGMMPDMDGLDVLRSINADPRLQGVPILFYSADSTPARIEQALALGAREFIVKGSTWGVLLSQVEKYAGQSSSLPNLTSSNQTR
jgi:two-component system sensor histidine kinase/response regulator